MPQAEYVDLRGPLQLRGLLVVCGESRWAVRDDAGAEELEKCPLGPKKMGRPVEQTFANRMTVSELAYRKIWGCCGESRSEAYGTESPRALREALCGQKTNSGPFEA